MPKTTSDAKGPHGTPDALDALVLAGRRSADDPLAAAAGAAHRALLEIEGEAMLARVLRTLAARAEVGRLVVSIDAPELLEADAALRAQIATGRLEIERSAPASPAESVLVGLARLGEAQAKPVLITTADHALLDDAMLDHFLAGARDSDADLCVGLVPESVLRERFPTAQRTYLPFRGERYSGANLFLLRTPTGRRVIEFWRRAERHRKQPWRLASAFGVANLLLFATRRLDLTAAMERASKTIGARVRAISIPIAEAAIDVDKLEDWRLVNQILSERASTTLRARPRTPGSGA